VATPTRRKFDVALIILSHVGADAPVRPQIPIRHCYNIHGRAMRAPTLKPNQRNIKFAGDHAGSPLPLFGGIRKTKQG